MTHPRCAHCRSFVTPSVEVLFSLELSWFKLEALEHSSDYGIVELIALNLNRDVAFGLSWSCHVRDDATTFTGRLNNLLELYATNCFFLNLGILNLERALEAFLILLNGVALKRIRLNCC